MYQSLLDTFLNILLWGYSCRKLTQVCKWSGSWNIAEVCLYLATLWCNCVYCVGHVDLVCRVLFRTCYIGDLPTQYVWNRAVENALRSSHRDGNIPVEFSHYVHSSFFFFCETRFCYVALADLELTTHYVEQFGLKLIKWVAWNSQRSICLLFYRLFFQSLDFFF